MSLASKQSGTVSLVETGDNQVTGAKDGMGRGTSASPQTNKQTATAEVLMSSRSRMQHRLRRDSAKLTGEIQSFAWSGLQVLTEKNKNRPQAG